MGKKSSSSKRGTRAAVAKKRSWRKADISDVEADLEDDRLVKKLVTNLDGHRKFNAPLDAEALFTVDTTGSSEGLSRSTKRELAKAKLLGRKLDKGDGLSLFEQDKIDRAEEVLGNRSRAPTRAAPGDVFDLWGDAAPAKAKPRVRVNGVLETAPVRKPGTLFQKLGVAPAVIPAHEGQSMNPDKEAYEELACKAASAELAREQESSELDRKLKPITHELRDHVDKEALEGMSEVEKLALYRSLACKSGAPAETEDGEEGALPKGKQKIKQQSKKNNAKKRKASDEKERQRLAQKKLDKSVGQVGAMFKDMKEKEEWVKQRAEYKKSLRAQRTELEKTTGQLLKKRKFGRTQFEEKAIVVPDAASMSSTKGLRGMSLESSLGSACEERMTSIVRRGLLPAPAENSYGVARRVKKQANRFKGRRQNISPLLKDNLLLR